MEDSRREYKKNTLSESEVDANPHAQFKVWFEQAEKSKNFEPNAFCLSTTAEGNRPSSRMLLLKGHTEEGFIFYTNYESRKGGELSRQPLASMLFFWPELERQVRIEGKVEKTPPKLSDEYFASRPRDAQISAVVSKQSSVVDGRESLESAWKIKANDTSGNIKRPDNWGGYLLRPEYIEFWQGREDRLHDRIVYKLSAGQWLIQRLAP